MDSLDDTSGVDWQTSMAALLQAVAATPEVVPPLKLSRGSIVSEHFRIERMLGAGGMGVVYLAVDERLKRRVALKLHARLAHEHGVERMMREATAMAQLNHPNVLTIHEVGTVDDHVFIAMEFIDGQTLRQWLRERPRPWSELRPVLLAAGEGLAAAHAAGLVHRDFKPENVLISKSGKVSVADFGLARAERDSHGSASASGSLADLDSNLTRTGALMGTPAYMAPEQCNATPVDARADQFAFCVTVYEALYGQRPFAGRAVVDLIDQITSGNVRPAPENNTVPRWLHDVVLRGLRGDPEERYADMSALLSELRADPQRARRRKIAAVAAAGALVAVLAVVFVLARRSAQTRPADVCAGGDERIAEVWNPERSERVRKSLLAVAPHLDSWPRVARSLATYADTWAGIRRDACEATTVQRSQAEDVMNKRYACLDRALVAFDGLLATFETTGLAGASRALESSYRLPPLEACNDLDLLKRMTDMERDARDEPMVATIRRELYKATVIAGNGRIKRALRLINNLEKDADKIPGGHLLAEVLLRKGGVLTMLGRHSEAEVSLRKAYDHARRSKRSSIAGIAAAVMIGVSNSKGNVQIADHWANLAKLELPHAGYRSVAAETIQLATADLRSRQGRYADAVAHLRAALRIEETLYGNNHLRIATTKIQIASALDALGKRTQAKHELQAALKLVEQLAGKSHPSQVHGLRTLSLLHNGAGEHRKAVDVSTRALAIARRAYGENHSEVAYCWQNHGVALYGLGRIDDAIAAYAKAIDIISRKLGRRHPDLGMLYSNMGVAYEQKGELDKALDYHERALRLLEARFGKDHYEVAIARTNLAATLTDKRRFARAIPYFRRAIDIFDAISPNDPTIIIPLNGLGASLIELGRAADAIAGLERALALGDKTKTAAERRARTRLNLANAMWYADKDRARAIRLMRAAGELYARLDKRFKHLLQFCERWLDRRQPTWRGAKKPPKPKRTKRKNPAP